MGVGIVEDDRDMEEVEDGTCPFNDPECVSDILGGLMAETGKTGCFEDVVDVLMYLFKDIRMSRLLAIISNISTEVTVHIQLFERIFVKEGQGNSVDFFTKWLLGYQDLFFLGIFSNLLVIFA